MSKIPQIFLIPDDEEDLSFEKMNAELDEQVQKDMEVVNSLINSKPKEPPKDTASKPTGDKPPVLQRIEDLIVDDDEVYQSMNAELDKQIADDMKAIRDYLSRGGQSAAERVEFFSKMGGPAAPADAPDRLLYQHTAVGTIKWHECAQCEFKCANREKLREHVEASHELSGEWLRCERCAHKTRRRAELEGHMAEVHGEKRTFACKDCDGSFASNEELLKHKEAEHNVSLFRCERCAFVTDDRAGLRHHVLMEHVKLNVSWYKCAQCAYRTVRKANLDRHIMYKHSVNTILM